MGYEASNSRLPGQSTTRKGALLYCYLMLLWGVLFLWRLLVTIDLTRGRSSWPLSARRFAGISFFVAATVGFLAAITGILGLHFRTLRFFRLVAAFFSAVCGLAVVVFFFASLINLIHHFGLRCKAEDGAFICFWIVIAMIVVIGFFVGLLILAGAMWLCGFVLVLSWRKRNQEEYEHNLERTMGKPSVSHQPQSPPMTEMSYVVPPSAVPPLPTRPNEDA